MQESFKSGICGRIGGDEFIIYLALDDANYEQLKRLLKNLNKIGRRILQQLIEAAQLL